MRVVIRKSPPLFNFQSNSAGIGMFRRMAAILLGLFAVASGFRCIVLLAAGLEAPSSSAAGTLMSHWHVWLGAALLSAVSSRLLWGSTQRPRNRE